MDPAAFIPTDHHEHRPSASTSNNAGNNNYNVSARMPNGTDISVSSSRPVNVKILHTSQRLQPNNFVDLPITDMMDSQLAHIIDSYRRNDFIGVFSPMVAKFIAKKLTDVLRPDEGREGDTCRHGNRTGTLGKVVSVSYDTRQGDKVLSVRLQTFGPISLDAMEGDYARVIPGSFIHGQQQPQSQPQQQQLPSYQQSEQLRQIAAQMAQKQYPAIGPPPIQQPQQPQQPQLALPPTSPQNAMVPFIQGQISDGLSDEDYDDDYDDEEEEEDEGLKHAHLFSSRALHNPEELRMLEYQAGEPTAKQPTDVYFRNMMLKEQAEAGELEDEISRKGHRKHKFSSRKAKRAEMQQLMYKLENMGIDNIQEDLSWHIEDTSSVPIAPPRKQKLLQDNLESYNNVGGFSRAGPSQEILQYPQGPSAMALLPPPPPPPPPGPPVLLAPQLGPPKQMLQLPYKYSPQKPSARNSLNGLVVPAKHHSSKKSVAKKNSAGFLNILSLVVPVSEPVFPATNIPNLRVVNPIQKQAIIHMANTNQFVGLFFIKDVKFKSFDIVNSSSDVHEYGVLAKVSSYSSYTGSEDGIKSLMVSLTTTSTVHIEELLPPRKRLFDNVEYSNDSYSNDTFSQDVGHKLQGHQEKALKSLKKSDLEGDNLQQCVCLANVSIHSIRYKKSHLPAIKQIAKKIMKNLSRLYHKSKKQQPGLADKFLEVLERNFENMESLAKEKQQKRHFDFYNVDEDDAEMTNIKLNVVADILKNYFVAKLHLPKEANEDRSLAEKEEEQIKLRYYLGVFQNVSATLQLQQKAYDVLNVVEIELQNYKTRSVTTTGNSNTNTSTPAIATERSTSKVRSQPSFVQSAGKASVTVTPIVETPLSTASTASYYGGQIYASDGGAHEAIELLEDETPRLSPRLSPEESTGTNSGTNNTLLSSFSLAEDGNNNNNNNNSSGNTLSPPEPHQRTDGGCRREEEEEAGQLGTRQAVLPGRQDGVTNNYYHITNHYYYKE